MLPHAFLQEMTALLGADEARTLAQALTQTAPPVSVRVNPLKPGHALPAEVEADVPWCTNGRYLSERPKFTYDPLLHAGTYYVQEAASMIIEQAWRQITADFIPRRLLDLCAAPGGKSTLWRSLMPDGALLVANEPIRQRAQILAENLTKWGHPDTVVTSAYADSFGKGLGGFFDVIATDVPCSGEGMFRKDEGAVAEWSPEAVEVCAARQWEIVSDVWPALRQGGYLVYSTCTYNRTEDEDMVARICSELGAEPIVVPTDPAWGVTGDLTGRGLAVCRFLPHKTKGEGLFIALLRKTAEAPIYKMKGTSRPGKAGKGGKGKGKKGGLRPAAADGAEVSKWLASPKAFRLIRQDEMHIIALSETLADEAAAVMAAAPTLTAGIALAEERGRKLIPQHALALSVARGKEAFPTTALSLDEALAYLRHEALTLPASTPRGYVLVTYQGQALGFVNNLGTRANNLYPQAWRIRT